MAESEKCEYHFRMLSPTVCKSVANVEEKEGINQESANKKPVHEELQNPCVYIFSKLTVHNVYFSFMSDLIYINKVVLYPVILYDRLNNMSNVHIIYNNGQFF